MAQHMARIAAVDGIVIACTPHINPSMYENTVQRVRAAVAPVQQELDQAGIALCLSEGAVQLDPHLLVRIRGGEVPTLAGSRDLLPEPLPLLASPWFRESGVRTNGCRYRPGCNPSRAADQDRNAPGHVRTSRRKRSLDADQRRRPARPLRPPLLLEAREAAARRVRAAETIHIVLTWPKGVIEIDPDIGNPWSP